MSYNFRWKLFAASFDSSLCLFYIIVQDVWSKQRLRNIVYIGSKTSRKNEVTFNVCFNMTLKRKATCIIVFIIMFTSLLLYRFSQRARGKPGSFHSAAVAAEMRVRQHVFCNKGKINV